MNRVASLKERFESLLSNIRLHKKVEKTYHENEDPVLHHNARNIIAVELPYGSILWIGKGRNLSGTSKSNSLNYLQYLVRSQALTHLSTLCVDRYPIN